MRSKCKPILLTLVVIISQTNSSVRGQQDGSEKSCPITSWGTPAELSIRRAGEHSIRIILKPVSDQTAFPFSPALADQPYPAPDILLTTLCKPIKKQVGTFIVAISPAPLTIVVTTKEGRLVQRLIQEKGDTLSFFLDGQPILGLGAGGPMPEPGKNWRDQPIEFNRMGRFLQMQPRWQSQAYGSRNPVPLMIGTGGWAMFVASPWVRIDLRGPDKGLLMPWHPHASDSIPPTEKNQDLTQNKGLPPADSIIPGLYDLFLFDAAQPAGLMKDLSDLTGPAVMPPRWAFGYMQSHRTLKDDRQMIAIVDSFRVKKIPLDVVIYLGTGFSPRGWNTLQPSFVFNPAVFQRQPADVLKELHDLHVKVVLHMVPFDRDMLPTLHGSIPAKPGEVLDSGHILRYWARHVPVMNAGADGFWPDEGDWFNLNERMKRHEMYYSGPLASFPHTRPWSLHRNGYLGIARWGGWIWSGDTESSWKTLEGQVAVGINASLSVSPYWGSDIGGFYANPEKTGELYTRWFEFGSFCPSFRSHGRTWMTSLPWGWGLPDRGVVEDARSVLPSEMANPFVEPITRTYADLHYQLLPYTYTLAWEARQTGMPLMRALWLQYPNDSTARRMGSEYLWGPDMLIAPVFEKGATARVLYLPKGRWYDWWTDKPLDGDRFLSRPVDLSIMPIYVRAGAIIPFDPIRQYTDEMATGPTTIRVYSGANGAFTLYEDDGISEDYLSGKAARILFIWNDRATTLSILPDPSDESPNRLPGKQSFIIELFPDHLIKNIAYDDLPVKITF